MVVAKPVRHRCSKCRKSYLPRKDIEETTCKECGTVIRKHKGCGGRVYVDDLDIRIR